MLEGGVESGAGVVVGDLGPKRLANLESFRACLRHSRINVCNV